MFEHGILNIPEEITYFITRIELYNLPFGCGCNEFYIDFNKYRFQKNPWILLLWQD
jgi:hypothetical protein